MPVRWLGAAWGTMSILSMVGPRQGHVDAPASPLFLEPCAPDSLLWDSYHSQTPLANIRGLSTTGGAEDMVDGGLPGQQLREAAQAGCGLTADH